MIFILRWIIDFEMNFLINLKVHTTFYLCHLKACVIKKAVHWPQSTLVFYFHHWKCMTLRLPALLFSLVFISLLKNNSCYFLSWFLNQLCCDLTSIFFVDIVFLEVFSFALIFFQLIFLFSNLIMNLKHCFFLFASDVAYLVWRKKKTKIWIL